MGFGSYDESEQENREYDTDFENDDEDIKTEEESHSGEVSFEFDASNDELLDRLKAIKDE